MVLRVLAARQDAIDVAEGLVIARLHEAEQGGITYVPIDVRILDNVAWFNVTVGRINTLILLIGSFILSH